MRSPDWQVVMCLDQSDDALDSLVAEMIAAKPFDKALSLAHCDTMTAEQLGQNNIILIANRWPSSGEFKLPQVDAMSKNESKATATPDQFLEVAISSTQLHLQGQEYRPDHIERVDMKGPFLKLNYYPNPWSTREDIRLMHLWYAPDAASLADHLSRYFGGNYGQVFWAQWAYQLETTNARYLGRYIDTTWYFDEPFVMTQSGEVLAQNEYWSVEAASEGINDAAFERVANYLQSLPDSIGREMPKLAIPDEPITVKLYASVERIGLQLGEMDTAMVDDAGTVHLVVNEQTFGERSAAPVYALLDAHLEAESWGENEQWGRALSLSPEGKLLSCYLPAAKEIGLLRAPETVRNDEPPEDGRSKIFLALERLLITDSASLFAPRAKRETELAPQKGMTFAHEGYRVYNGYGGSTVEPSLSELAKLNVNSIAVVPYSFMRSPRSLKPIPVSDFAGGENDAATIASAKAAHKRGWSVMLKPQIWLGGGSWPGDIIQDTEKAWQQFFDNYRAWILHYAILADMHGLETFCLGTEMRHTTLQRSDDWLELVEQARSLYGGTLTYAANWGEEAEQMSFWSAFDVIGVNAYYPLCDSENPSDAELKAGVNRWLSKVEHIAEAANRPLWLTEIGYRSVTAPWRNPHAGPEDRAANEVDQSRSYQALFEVLSERNTVSGIYIWKWPSHLSYVKESGDTGFTTAGKQAQNAIKRFYN
ncbi:MAG: glycoside hydrolase TIM-barrel-like domain-containing protein [Bacteroidota bacterium]